MFTERTIPTVVVTAGLTLAASPTVPARADDDLRPAVRQERMGAGSEAPEPADTAAPERAAEQRRDAERTPADASRVRADRAIAAAIDRALREDAIIERGRIEVTVSDRIAALRGVIASGTQWRRVNHVMSRIDGLDGFVNALTVGYEPPADAVMSPRIMERNPILFNHARSTHVSIRRNENPPAVVGSDAELRESIAFEIWLSPFVTLDEVEIEVDDGVAFLAGIVDSWSEREAATENALEGGATVVANALRVRDAPVGFGPNAPAEGPRTFADGAPPTERNDEVPVSAGD